MMNVCLQVVQAMAPLIQDVDELVAVARTRFAHVQDGLLDSLRRDAQPQVWLLLQGQFL